MAELPPSDELMEEICDTKYDEYGRIVSTTIQSENEHITIRYNYENENDTRGTKWIYDHDNIISKTYYPAGNLKSISHGITMNCYSTDYYPDGQLKRQVICAFPCKYVSKWDDEGYLVYTKSFNLLTVLLLIVLCFLFGCILFRSMTAGVLTAGIYVLYAKYYLEQVE